MGQWASFKLLNEVCTPSSVCTGLTSGFSSQAAGTLEVTHVLDSTVTVRGTSTGVSGAGSVTQMTVDVSAGTLNGTIEPTAAPFYPLIAANLGAGAHVWNSASAPTINSTTSLNLFGSMRTIDMLNFTHSEIISAGPYSSSFVTSYGGAWDQSTGILVEFSFNITSTSLAYPAADTKALLRFGMVNNNIWASGTYPDFSLSASAAANSPTQSGHLTSTITVNRMGGFLTTVNLAASSSSPNLSCSISPSTLANGGPDSATLDCTGSPGTYTVTVTGNSGYSTHTTQSTMIINSPGNSSSRSSTSTQPTLLGDFLLPLIIIGIIGVGIVVALVVVMTRRKAPLPPATSTDTPQSAPAQP